MGHTAQLYIARNKIVIEEAEQNCILDLVSHIYLASYIISQIIIELRFQKTILVKKNLEDFKRLCEIVLILWDFNRYFWKTFYNKILTTRICEILLQRLLRFQSTLWHNKSNTNFFCKNNESINNQWKWIIP
jgi:hypothetical protein